jgi:nickel-dependent lactate racemase
MKVELAYGKTGLRVQLPSEAVVIQPQEQSAALDPVGAVAAAIAHPLGARPLAELARGKSVCVVTSDLTRPVPNGPILHALLPALERAGARTIEILIATGLHRPNTQTELCSMLGEDIVKKYTIVNHRAKIQNELKFIVNLADGTPLWVNRHYAEAECRILTGFIEPHFFAGFSGGRKAVLPGIAGEETIRANHSAAHLSSPMATFGRLEDNPVHLQMLEAARSVGADFIINVATDNQHRITGVFAGDLILAHNAGVRFVRESSMFPLEEACDLAITTNSGYPLDLNLYQAVKGLAAASQITKPGGSIILAAQCCEGIGGAEFAALLKEAASPEDLLARILQPGFYQPDQWTAQILARILAQFKVYLYADGVTAQEAEACHLKPLADIEAAVEKLRGNNPDFRIAVLPQGPMVIPYLKERER